MKNIFAYTETNYTPETYPAYISINRDYNGSFWIGVRERSDDTSRSARISVPPETLEHLAAYIMAFFGEEEESGSKEASEAVVNQSLTTEPCEVCGGDGVLAGSECGFCDGENADRTIKESLQVAESSAPARDMQEAFEAKFPMPANCTRYSGGYSPTSYSAWDAQAYVQKWEGWKAAYAALQSHPAQAGKESLEEALMNALIRCTNLSSDAIDERVAEMVEICKPTAAPSASVPAQAVTLKPAEIEQGWRDTFSTNNPFCPCDLGAFTKAVKWAERRLFEGAKQ